ncbi:MAG: DUF433 domain-containing protein, partial [Proteobacteria bacterium]|nr:DUF433 domain-containing protein [Pseudomonadota bacterium]
MSPEPGDRRTATFDRITFNPAIVNGQPTIRGMRLSVRRAVEALAIYPGWDDLRREYPELELEDIHQALEYASTQFGQECLTACVRLKRLLLDQGLSRSTARLFSVADW